MAYVEATLAELDGEVPIEYEEIEMPEFEFEVYYQDPLDAPNSTVFQIINDNSEVSPDSVDCKYSVEVNAADTTFAENNLKESAYEEFYTSIDYGI